MDELKLSLRQLRKTPVFTVAAVTVLALGIGLNAAMFSVVHAFVFAARPFQQPEQLVQLYDQDERATADYRSFSFAVYQQLAARAEVFDGLLAHSLAVVGLGDGALSRRTFSAIVSSNYFEVLGVPLLQGRGFTAEESRPGQNIPVVVTTYAYWRRTNFDPSLLGRTIRVNERPFTVVGIAPRGFTGTMTVLGPELFFPLGVFHSLSDDFQRATARTLDGDAAFNLFLVGRLREGVSVRAASAAVNLFGKSLARTAPAEYERRSMSVAELPRFGTNTSPSDQGILGTLGIVLLGMTAAVLLTVCLNLMSMLLARGRARRKEFAVRLALGGSRMRIVRQLLIEGLLLSAVGGTLGLLLGRAAIDMLLAAVAGMLPITMELGGAVSPALVGATAFFCVLATLTFALRPALQHSRADILSDLKAHTGDDPAPRRWRFVPRNPLVAAQVALSLCLLIAAGLFAHMALGAAAVDQGFRADDTVLAEVDGRLGGLDDASTLNLYAQLEERLGALPGVQSASVGALVPLGSISMSRDVQRAGVALDPNDTPVTPEAGRAYSAPWNAVGAKYFEAMGVALLQGRGFTAAETFGQGAPAVTILDETLARRLWPAGDALGQRVQWAPAQGSTAPSRPMEVVGIVAATRGQLFERTPRGAVYVPLAQEFVSNVHFHVRPVAPSDGLVDAVRREVRAVAPGVPLFGVRTFEAHLANAPEPWALALSAALFAFFSGLAVVVALVGIYAVTAYAVVRRTREIGVRIAIGAAPSTVWRGILRDSLATTLCGIAAGWLLGLGMGRLMASLFVDVVAFEPWTFALVPVGFVVAAVVATWIPAQRATAINPVVALRSE